MGSAAGSAYGLAASSALSYMRSRPLLGILGGEKFHRALDEVVYLSYDAETTLQPNTTDYRLKEVRNAGVKSHGEPRMRG